ncbi:alpha/beta hydrolase [Sphingomonas sp. Leaf21]|uniref:alpha/beta hydrolase n=1 Tax=Sphingomonas sp. Leaf21 TaxID=2876550 RepID=UPI001E536A42|nr:alpha/beta fold hydrolase [Sphingomonas sp. Leaf21]
MRWAKLLLLAGLVGGPLALSGPGRAQDRTIATRVIDMPRPNGADQRVLLSMPVHPRGMILMLPGGAGDIGIERDGTLRHGDNFVVRAHGLWNARGYGVLIPDALGHANMRGRRSSPGYARVIGDLVALAHREGTGPVFLLGTSQGSVAAMNGAAHAAPGSIAGVVLTESVSVMGGSHETVFDADPAGVTVPALVIANSDDACKVASPDNASRIATAMKHSPMVQVIAVSGGVTRSDNPCGSLTPHGYYGIEDKVVGVIARWMDLRSR